MKKRKLRIRSPPFFRGSSCGELYLQVYRDLEQLKQQRQKQSGRASFDKTAKWSAEQAAIAAFDQSKTDASDKRPVVLHHCNRWS